MRLIKYAIPIHSLKFIWKSHASWCQNCIFTKNNVWKRHEKNILPVKRCHLIFLDVYLIQEERNKIRKSYKNPFRSWNIKIMNFMKPNYFRLIDPFEVIWIKSLLISIYENFDFVRSFESSSILNLNRWYRNVFSGWHFVNGFWRFHTA